MAAIHRRDVLVQSLPGKIGEIDYVVAKTKQLSEAAREAGVFLLPKGALENHLAGYAGSIFQVPERAKAATFEAERDFILANSGTPLVEARYADLIPILDLASGACEVNLRQHLAYAIGVFIGNVQVAFERREIDSADSLKQHASVDWNTYNRILDLVSFNAADGKFACRIKLKMIVDVAQTEFDFADDTVHSKFALPAANRL